MSDIEQYSEEIARLRRLLNGVREAFKRECDDLDAILRTLGLAPENCRTEGGSLMLQDVLGKIKHREAALRYEARLHKDRADDCGRLARMVLDQECLSDEPHGAEAHEARSRAMEAIKR